MSGGCDVFCLRPAPIIADEVIDFEGNGPLVAQEVIEVTLRDADFE